MGIKDKEFREGNSKSLQNAFGRRILKGPAICYDAENEKLLNLGLKPVKKLRRSKSSDMVLLHEAFQYLIKRKSLQVINFNSFYIFFYKNHICRNKHVRIIMALVKSVSKTVAKYIVEIIDH